MINYYSARIVEEGTTRALPGLLRHMNSMLAGAEKFWEGLCAK